MTSRVLRLLMAGAIVFAPALMAQSTKVPRVPTVIEVPAGNTVFLKGQAAGSQNHMCIQEGSSYSWRFIGPLATLFVSFKLMGNDIEQQVTTHFPSLNPMEPGTSRPTWQHSFDSSRVWGEAIGSTTDPTYVAPGAIAWLLLRAAGKAPGPEGGTALSQTTFIQRVNTTGGLAPSIPCNASNLKTIVFVPYTADYYFYKAGS